MRAVFRDLMCQRADWTLLGARAYATFSQYFSSLRKQEAEEAVTVGLDALWRIALTARTVQVAEAATKDLLCVYGETGVGGAEVDGGANRLEFLRRIFEHLEACQKGLSVSPPVNGNAESSLKAERCLRLLQGAVASGRGAAGQPASLAHGVRGQAGRRCVVIEPRKILQHPSTVGNRGPLQKLEPFQVRCSTLTPNP